MPDTFEILRQALMKHVPGRDSRVWCCGLVVARAADDLSVKAIKASVAFGWPNAVGVLIDPLKDFWELYVCIDKHAYGLKQPVPCLWVSIVNPYEPFLDSYLDEAWQGTAVPSNEWRDDVKIIFEC